MDNHSKSTGMMVHLFRYKRLKFSLEERSVHGKRTAAIHITNYYIDKIVLYCSFEYNCLTSIPRVRKNGMPLAYTSRVYI